MPAMPRRPRDERAWLLPSRSRASPNGTHAGARGAEVRLMSAWVDALSWACLVAGGVFCIVGAVGLLRMPDFYTRMHAASVVDTLGATLVLLGLMLQAGFTLVAVKLLMVGVLIYFASPTATHALARAAMVRGLQPLLADDPKEPPSKR
jgi:multicomponent Na+:H+ antiporter subunit G